MTHLQAAHRLTNLPIPPTPLIGRDADLEAVHQRLWRSSPRLLTLTGAGGCGKTRLALEAGRAAFGSFSDGVWLVGLAPVADPRLVPEAVAGVFGVRESPERTLVEVLSMYLEPRRLLLLLDNCEHLIDACAVLVEGLLAACPDLRIMATSREPLRIAAEVTWRVPSLAFPDPRSLLTAAEVAAAPAVQLFAERAQAVQPDFAIFPRGCPGLPRRVRRGPARPPREHRPVQRSERCLGCGHRPLRPWQSRSCSGGG